MPYPVAATLSAFRHPVGFVCALSLGPAWPGCCAGGAKREVGKVSSVVGISSSGLGSPWEADLGSFLLAEPYFAGREVGRRGCFGPMGFGTATHGLKRSMEVPCGSLCQEGWGLNTQICINFIKTLALFSFILVNCSKTRYFG